MSFRQQLRAYLAELPEISFALLFGSRARGQGPPGRPRGDSDWDLAVYLDNGLDRRQRFKSRCRMAADLEALAMRWWANEKGSAARDDGSLTAAPVVDLVILNDASVLLGHRALRGEWLLVRDEVAKVRYMVRTLQRIDDERYWLDLHWRGLRERMREEELGRH